MERWRLADIFSISKTALNQSFSDEPSPLHFKFQAAIGVLQRFQPESGRGGWWATSCPPYGLGAGINIRQPEKGVRVGCRGLPLLVVGGETPALAKNRSCAGMMK